MNSKISLNTIMKLINIIFLIVLENIILDSGMGIFGVSLAVYYVFYTLFFSSLQAGIAKMVSIRNNKGINGKSKHIVKPALVYVFIVCMLVNALGFVVLEAVCVKLLGMSYPVPVIQILFLVLLFTSLADVLCGYHNGNGNVIVSNISNLLKCILPIIFSFFIIRLFSGYGNKVSVLLKNTIVKDAYSAMGIATLYLCSSVIILVIISLFTIKSRMHNRTENSMYNMDMRRAGAGGFLKVNGKLMLHNIFPVLSVFIAILFYINGVRKAGLSIEDAYTNLGILFAKLFLPFVFIIIVFSDYISRERHRLRVDYRKDEIKIMTVRAQYMIKNSLFMLIPPTMILIFLANPIAKVLYSGQRELTVKYLQTGGALLLLIGIVYAMSNILKAFEKEILVWLVQGSSVIAQAAFLLIGFSNAKGDSMMVIYSFYFYYTIQLVIFMALILQQVRLDVLDILMKLGKYGVAGIIMMILFMILDKFITMNIFLFMLSVFFGYLLYYLTLIALHGISKKDEAALKKTLNYYPVHFLRSRLRL